MKPIARIGQVPAEFVIYHELGHAYSNKHFGRSCSIEFLPGIDAGAGTQSGWAPGAVDHDPIVTDLAGAFAQALYCEETIAMPIRQQILENTLFDNGELLSGNFPAEAFFFQDDLQLIRLKLARRNTPDLNDQIAICRSAFQVVHQIFSLPKRDAFFVKAHRDILLWLEEDDRGLSHFDN